MAFSIDNPQPFDYLKVVEWSRDEDDAFFNYQNVFPLMCVVRNSVHIQYKDNSTYSINFDVFNDGSLGFKALHEQSRILAGDQIFVVQKYTKKVNGVGTASIQGVQLVNADFPRVRQPRMYRYKSKDAKGSTETQNVSYVTLDELLQWFFSGIESLGFKYRIHGYFPRRPIKNIGHWNGKELLTNITRTWPGTVIIGWGHIIHIYGYQKERDPNGDLQSIRDVETGERIDAMFDTKDISITRDTSKMLNALEVKAATHSVVPENDNDDDDDVDDSTDSENELVYREVPYFPDMIVRSDRSINKYGMYVSQDILDDGFTNKEAALAAAREHMVLDPVITISATVDHPGKVEIQPVPGRRYTVGIEQENEAYHVILRGFDWYCFDSTKGVQLSFDNVDPGIVDNLRTTIVHDVELSPTITTFKALSDNSTDTDVSTGDSGELDDGGDGSDLGDDAEAPSDDDLNDDYSIDSTSNDLTDTGTDIDSVDNDDQQDRPDDNGNGTSDPADKDKKPKFQRLQKAFKAFLAISDKLAHAHISRFGNFTLWRGNKLFVIRVASRSLLKKLRDGTFNKDDVDDMDWQHSFMLDFNHYGNSWLGDKNHPIVRKFWRPTDIYAGGNVLTETALAGTTAPYWTFVDNLKDSDFHGNGTLKHHPDSHNVYHDYKNHPGNLARIYAGTVYAHVADSSLLSQKKQVKELSKEKALGTILHTDIGTYKYKGEKNGDTHASVIIDDVDKLKKWRTPKAFITRDGKHRKDDVAVGYLIKSVQALQDQINDLQQENKELKKQLKNKN